MRLSYLFLLSLVIQCIAAANALAWRAGCDADAIGFQTAEGGCKNQATGLVWTLNFSNRYEFLAAKSKCTAFADGKYSDWRLPSRDELKEMALNKPDTNLPEDFQNYNAFWADDNSTSEEAWVVILGEARIREDIETARLPKEDNASVVCVRQGSTKDYGCLKDTVRFITGYGGCLDLTTSLVWSKIIEREEVGEFAEQKCREYMEPFTGLGGWRLPTMSQRGGINTATESLGPVVFRRALPDHPTRVSFWFSDCPLWTSPANGSWWRGGKDVSCVRQLGMK